MAMSWLRWTFAVAMIGVALFHVARVVGVRVVVLRPRHRPESVTTADFLGDLTHAAMGAVMTVMLLGVLGPVEGRRLAVLFGIPLVWFGWRAMRGYVMDGPRAVGSPARHVVGCAAMLYMLLAISGASETASSMPGMAMRSTSPPFSIAVAMLLVATLGVTGWTVARPRAVGLPAPPALAAGCQLAMNAATVYMLLAI